MLTLCFKIQPAKTESEAIIYVDPSTIEVLIGSVFTINVSVSDVADLFGFEFYLAYDTTFLDVLSVIIKPPFDRGFHPLIEIVEPDGFVHVAAMLPPSDPSVSGCFPLTSITLNTTAAGSCILDLHDTIMINSMFDPISHITVDGYVTVYSPKEAAIVRAWPKYHHLVLSWEEPQTLYANVTNSGIEHVWVKVRFEIVTDEGVFVTSLETGIKRIQSNPHHNFKILKVEWMPTPSDVGKYYVAATCYYDADCGRIPEVMDGMKTFSFAVVP